MLPIIFPLLKIYIWREREGTIKGFVAVSSEKIEILFVHPKYLEQSIKTQLINFCKHSLGIRIATRAQLMYANPFHS